MPTTNAEYDSHTTGQTVVSTFSERVKDKIILITGANPGGIGGSTAESLSAVSPKLLILAGRGQARLDQTVASIGKINSDIACKTLILDLSSQESCKKAAQEVLEDASIPQIDILINNAGVMDIPERILSPEGIEMQFATNHIGHFLFTNLILPKITSAAKAGVPGATRIINLSSLAVVYGPVRFSDYNFTKCEKGIPEAEHLSKDVREMWHELEDKPYIPQAAYGQSKTANVLFSVELNKRLFEKFGVTSVAVHPGGIMTELSRHSDQDKLNAAVEAFKKQSPDFFLKNLQEGCSTTLVAALDPKVTKEDIFWGDCQPAGWAPEHATSPAQAEKLWKLSEELVGQQFSY